MATKRAVKKQPVVDVKALAAEIGATVKEGKLTTVRNKYILTVGNTKNELVPGEMIDEAELKKLAGQIVPVVVSGRTIVALGYPDRPWCYILCYVPGPDIWKRIRPELRVQLIKQYAAAGVINSKLEQVLLTPIQLP
ncbi:hypothetical protein [Paludibaculum fermentans]|uniref:hypothetical protein n=1 Tax=Paludibaculum fermentans TaxID=1473598 RepID=UPI003EB8EA96